MSAIPVNYAKFNKSDLISVFGAESLSGFAHNFESTGVSTDTRTLKGGNIFAALKGENFDGHSKIAEAFEKGAAAAIIEIDPLAKYPEISSEFPIIYVHDVQKALGKLASLHRSRFTIPVVAVAGSNGKTTTKEMIASVLQQKFNVLKTYSNFNNQLGTPLTLLELNERHSAAVIELGTNEPGEIILLSEMASPNFGVITNIGKEHLEKLIDLDGVEMEETSLFGYLHKNGGVCFVNIDDERLAKYMAILDNYVSYGTDERASIKCDFSLNNLLEPQINVVSGDKQFSVEMKTLGITSALNALPAISVGLTFGLEPYEIKAGLESFLPLKSDGYARMAVGISEGIVIINDCYNANPSSMKMALDTLNAYKTKGRKIAALGDMRELGESSFSEHTNLLAYAAEICKKVFVTGEEMNKALSNKRISEKISYFPDKHSLSAELKNYISREDVLLIKGSRGMKMEEIAASFPID